LEHGAVREYLFGETGPFHLFESQMNKKILFVSQGKYPVELKCDGLGDTGFYKIPADAPVSISFLHVQGTNLSQSPR